MVAAIRHRCMRLIRTSIEDMALGDLQPGGIKEITLADQMVKDPTKVIESAVRGMLAKNKLLDERMKRLKVYATAEHPHAPQSPKELPMKGAK